MKKWLLTAVLVTAFLFGVAFAGNQTTSSTTGTALIAQARYYLNEATAAFWTEAELLRWLNDGMVDIVSRTHCLESIESKTLALQATTYPLTSTFLAVKNVVYKSYNEKVTNGTMEADSSWTDQVTPTTNERSTTQVFAGTYAWKFTVNAADEGTKNSTFTTVTGTTYYYILWVYPDDSTSVNVYIYNGAGTGASVDADHTGLTQDAWNVVSGSWTEAGAGGASAYLAVRSPTGTAAGTWYIDNASIYSTGYSKPLRKGSIEHMAEVDSALGEPSYWTAWGNNVIVYPPPNSSASGKVIDVYLLTRPTAILAASTVTTPAQFDRALIWYMVAQALYKDEKYAKASKFMADYYAELDRFRLDFSAQAPAEQIR